MTTNDLTPEIIDMVTAMARIRGINLGLRGADLEDYIGDGYLAMCLLANEWNPERGVPLHIWISGRLHHRIMDIHRQRHRGFRQHRHLQLIPQDPHDMWGTEMVDPTTTRDISADAILWEVATDDRDRFILRTLSDGTGNQTQLAHALGVSKTRIAQLIERIRKRATRHPDFPATMRTRHQ